MGQSTSLPDDASVLESAAKASPHDLHAQVRFASALLALDRPQAAYDLLNQVRPLLMANADGATNLAITAEACGSTADARACYGHALALQPNHVNALNNLGLMQAREGQWESAKALASRCVELLPGEASLWLNWCDLLIRCRDHDQALEQLDIAIKRFPALPEFALRRAMVLAFQAQFDQSQSAFKALPPDAWALYEDFSATASRDGDRAVHGAPVSLPDPQELYCQQAYQAMQVCDWRDHDRLTALIRQMLAHSTLTGEGKDWRDTQFYALMLPLHENELARIREISIATIGARLSPSMPAFIARRSASQDDRIRVGIAAQSLQDPRYANALARQLCLHDPSRFAIHIYVPSLQPKIGLDPAFASQNAVITNIAGLSNDEAVARIRLDRLDLFMDAAFNTPWCRPEIPERRVAAVQIRQMTWHRHHPSRPCEYNMSDTFIHPDGKDLLRYGAVSRLPHSCWLALNDDLPAALPLSRADIGVPGDALVLCALLPALMIDPETFSVWMQIMRGLPHALLMLPSYGAPARLNLVRQAEAAGVRANRLVFLKPLNRNDMLAHLSLADLFIDAIRVNSNHGLADALRLGLPAITCAGNNMASRLGGSILASAGLPEAIVESPAAYLAEVLHLGRNPAALDRMRESLKAARPTAALFDGAARVKEWEAAWTMMVERSRAGLQPAAFDVPMADKTVCAIK